MDSSSWWACPQSILSSCAVVEWNNEGMKALKKLFGNSIISNYSLFEINLYNTVVFLIYSFRFMKNEQMEWKFDFQFLKKMTPNQKRLTCRQYWTNFICGTRPCFIQNHNFFKSSFDALDGLYSPDQPRVVEAVLNNSF